MDVNPIRFFKIVFLKEVDEFFVTIDKKAVKKILYRIGIVK